MTTEERLATPAYIWFDAEFTGLDTDSASLLQVAAVATSPGLTRLTPPERDVNLFIRLAPDVKVSDWVEKNLAALLLQCRSNAAVEVEEADRRLAALVDEAVGPAADNVKRRPVMTGNTVHMDMALARKHLPGFVARLHYRLLDVSTVKTLWGDWFAGVEFDKSKADLVRLNLPAGFVLPASGEHDAYYDILASIAELNFYRRQLARKEGA